MSVCRWLGIQLDEVRSRYFLAKFLSMNETGIQTPDDRRHLTPFPNSNEVAKQFLLQVCYDLLMYNRRFNAQTHAHSAS